MADATKYNPLVAWKTVANNVAQLTRETVNDPATYKIKAAYTDSNDLGFGSVEVGYTFTDYIGNPYRISNTQTIDVYSTVVKYGYLYNWYSVSDSRKITSSNDWVVPTRNEFLTVISYVSGDARLLKEVGTTYWESNAGATNETMFNARGAGLRYDDDGTFDGIKVWLILWTSSIYTAGYAQQIQMYSYNDDIVAYETTSSSYKAGNAVRLLYTGSGTPTSYVGNDGSIYSVVKIGDQYWLASNLAETKYRNGDSISVITDDTEWSTATTEARCAYNNDNTNAATTTQIGEYYNLTVVDDFRTGHAPTSGHIGYVHKSAYKGYSLYLPSHAFRHLHPTAQQNNQKYSLAILWGNDPNSHRYPFTASTEPKITNYQGTQVDGRKLSEDYGENPKVRLMQTDEFGNTIERTERSYFQLVDGKIDVITFGTLPDVIDGYIEISR